MISASRKIWHEGAEGWIPACEVRVLESEFEKLQVEPPPVPEELKVKAAVSVLAPFWGAVV